MQRRRFAGFMLIAALAVASMAVPVNAPAQQPLPYGLKPGQPYKGTTLNVLWVATPQFHGLQMRDEEFTRLTGIAVKYTEVPFPNLQEKVSAVGVAANGDFDVVNYLDSWGPSYGRWLVALDKFIARDGLDMNRYPDAFKKSVTVSNQVMGLPLRGHPQLLFYRADLLRELNLKAPSTWQEVIETGKLIKAKKGIAPLACYYGADGNRQNLFIWLNFLWGAGEKIFDAKGMPAWTTPGALKATRDYIELHTKHQLCAEGATSFVEQDARTSYNQGRAAMVPVWWWHYSTAVNPKQSTLKPEQVGFVAMPAYGKAVSYAITMPFSISKYSKQQEAAWEYLKWVSNPDLEKKNATERTVKGKEIINNVVLHKASLLDPQINAANANIQYAAAISLRESDVMPLTPDWPQVGDLLSQAINKAALGGNVDELMKDAARQAERVLRRAQRK